MHCDQRRQKVTGETFSAVTEAQRGISDYGGNVNMQSDSATVGDRLIDALLTAGCDTAFGVPGDFVLSLNQRLEQRMRFVGTSDEQGAGFAADAYARLRGIGCVVVTWGVGGLKVVNTTAQAWAENSPVVVVSGAPGLSEQSDRAMLHHLVKSFDTQMRVMAEVTAMTVRLEDPSTAARDIAEAIATAQRQQKPVYIEIPRDIEGQLAPELPPVPAEPGPHPSTVADALADVIEFMGEGETGAILVGSQVARLGLQPQLAALARHVGMPVAETFMGKSCFGGSEDVFIGVYAGALSEDRVRQTVEQADRVILLGETISDLNTGMFTANVLRDRLIVLEDQRTTVRRRAYEGVGLTEIINGLMAHWDLQPSDVDPTVVLPAATEPVADAPLGIVRAFDIMTGLLGPDQTILADPGDALFGSIQLHTERSGYLASAYYASLGFAVPGALGAGIARPDRRPVVIVGDGAFQMTGLELAGMDSNGVHPVLIVLNNSGYGTERPMLDGEFNDIPAMQYAQFPAALGSGVGVRATTEGDFDQALRAALADMSQLRLVEAIIPQHEISPVLGRLTSELGRRVAK